MTMPKAFAATGLWAVFGGLLVLIDAPPLLRFIFAGTFFLFVVGVTCAVALPAVRGVFRYALVLVAGLAAWLLNGSLLVYSGLLATTPSWTALGLTMLECAVIAAVSLVTARRAEARTPR